MRAAHPPDRALARIESSGLFAERIDESPYLWQSDDPPARAADSAFWDEVKALVTSCGPLLLEEAFVQNASHWHQLTAGRIEEVRAGLTSRSRLLLWPAPSTNLRTVRKDLRRALRDGLAHVVSEGRDGVLTDRFLFRRREVKAALTGVRAAMVMPVTVDEHHPLVTAVLPDTDGVVRARWTP